MRSGGDRRHARLVSIGALALRDVVVGLQNEAVAVDFNQLMAALHEDAPLVLGALFDLAGPALEFGEHRHKRRELHGMDRAQQLVARPAQSLVARVAIKLLRTPVPLDDAARLVPHDDRLEGELNQLGLQASRRFGALACRDIDSGAGGPHHIACGVAEHAARVEDPDVMTVLVPHPVFEDVTATGCDIVGIAP